MLSEDEPDSFLALTKDGAYELRERDDDSDDEATAPLFLYPINSLIVGLGGPTAALDEDDLFINLDGLILLGLSSSSALDLSPEPNNHLAV